MPTKLSALQIKARLSSLPGWRTARGQLKKKYVLGDFVEALRFVNRVGRLAEAEGHHPDIAMSYNEVTLTLSTHSIGGISNVDCKLAGEIEAAVPKPRAQKR